MVLAKLDRFAAALILRPVGVTFMVGGLLGCCFAANGLRLHLERRFPLGAAAAAWLRSHPDGGRMDVPENTRVAVGDAVELGALTRQGCSLSRTAGQIGGDFTNQVMRAPMIPAIYSDLVNHALAFAAKHHEGQPRKGTTVPYLTHLANVAIILARSGCDEKTIVAGVLHDVIEDCEREGCSPESHQRQIRGKFGDDVLGAVLAVTKPKSDGARRLTSSESKAGYLEQIRKAPERSLWVSAADKLHNQRRAAFSSSSHTGPSRARTAMYSSIPSKRF